VASIYKTSTFSLAKGDLATGDDFASVRVFDDTICVAVLCDGVGSAEAGAKASKRTVNYLINNFKNRPKSWSIEKSLRHFIKNINEILYREGIDEYERPEYVTTLSIAVIENNRLYGANVGDSPIWLERDGELIRLSIPHTSDEKGMEHVLTQAIGLSESVEPYLFENNLRVGDRVIIASDGLEAVLSEDEILQKASLGATSLIKYASKKVKDDLPDDTTAIVVDVIGESKTQTLKNISLPIPTSLSKGEVIDGYKLIKPLIANERTWLVEKKGVKYVMKFPSIEAIDDENYLDLFVREAWNASRLKAGFFPKAVIPRNRTVRYYIMEYIEGKTLKETISKKPISVEDSIALAKFLLHACSFLLKYDLVHGDIKPENIIIFKRRDKIAFKLIDFGSIVEIFSIASRAGTPSYLAPERFAGEPISEQSEIFAIGVTIYEALTKKYPYGEIEPFQTPKFKLPKYPRRYNPTIPAWLEAVILRAVESDKDRRYQLYSEMEYELTHPQEVKPYYPKGVNFFQREPLLTYRVLLAISLLANIYLLALVVNR